MSGIADMWADVMKRAVMDAKGQGSTTRDQVMEAHAFLTDATGKWAESRGTICWAMGVDPEYVREKMVRTLPHPLLVCQGYVVSEFRHALARAKNDQRRGMGSKNEKVITGIYNRACKALANAEQRLAELQTAHGSVGA